ncbi:MAG TPA: hypothetical protein VN257_09485, partial [Actinotalea sp.]|nr:hypothetical protein [Actinotalea sp.]
TPETPELNGFVAMPMSVIVVGTYDATVNFLAALQTGTERLFLVTRWTATGQDESQASGGRPATAPGDLEFSIGGYAYVLTDPNAPTEPVEGAEEQPLPGAVPGKNPFVGP